MSPISPIVLTLPGGKTITQISSSAFLIGNPTLRPDGPAFTIFSTPISFNPAATVLIHDSLTVPFDSTSVAVLTSLHGTIVM